MKNHFKPLIYVFGLRFVTITNHLFFGEKKERKGNVSAIFNKKSLGVLI